MYSIMVRHLYNLWSDSPNSSNHHRVNSIIFITFPSLPDNTFLETINHANLLQGMLLSLPQPSYLLGERISSITSAFHFKRDSHIATLATWLNLTLNIAFLYMKVHRWGQKSLWGNNYLDIERGFFRIPKSQADRICQGRMGWAGGCWSQNQILQWGGRTNVGTGRPIVATNHPGSTIWLRKKNFLGNQRLICTWLIFLIQHPITTERGKLLRF